MAQKLQKLPHEIEVNLKEGNIEECKKLFLECEPNAISWCGSNIFSLVPMPREFAIWAKEQGADINFTDHRGQTPIFEIGRRDGDIPLLIELGANVRDVRTDGCTPLHIAAARGQKKAVRALIKAGAVVDAQTKDYDGYGHFTPLEKVLYEPDLSSIKKYDLCKILLGKGAEITERSRQFVSSFTETFHRHNAGKKALKSLQNHEAALEKLCEMFDVKMLDKTEFHDGVSPIIITNFLSFKDNFWETWDFLVPPKGRAQTAQGEVIRIAGRIHHELLGNGGINWDEDYKKMLHTFKDYCHYGNGVSWSDEMVNEIVDMLKDGYVHDGIIWRLQRCALDWVEQNPEVMPLLEADYNR